jgi:Protein of unknown function (DUF3892)
MARYRVTCTTTREKNEGIISLGCYSPGNVYFTFTEEEVIARIDSGRDTFYSERPNGHIADLEVDTRHGKRYVRTKPDGELPDNLLSLPKCTAKVHRAPAPVRTVVPAASHGVDWWWA